MDDNDFEALIEIFRSQLMQIGEIEVAEFAEYTIETDDGFFVADPRKRFLKMLEAFETVVKLEHSGTLENIKLTIAEATGGEVPEFQIRLTPQEQTGESEVLRIELTDQSETLGHIKRLRGLIDGDEGGYFRD